MDRRPPHAGVRGLRRRAWVVLLSALAAVTAITVEARRSAPPACGVDLKLLVLSADGRETVLPAITETLDYIGVPYQVHVASRAPAAITPEFLRSGCRGFYQGIIQTTGSLALADGTGVAITPAETDALVAYAAQFDVRQVNWYAWPNPELGLFYTTYVDTAATPIPVTFTAAGRTVFPYLSAAAPPTASAAGGLFPRRTPGLAISQAWAYLASPIDAQTVPLLTTAAGDVLAAVRHHADGREVLTQTFDGNPHLTHTVALGYGLVNWVTRGVFVGARRVYMSPQVDDLFLHNDRWLPSTPCGTPVDGTGNDVRMTGVDLKTTVAWQRLRRLDPMTRDLRLTMAYNGYGAQKDVYAPDTLTPAVRSYQGDFYWVSHTFTHETLDVPTTYAMTQDELTRNQRTAKQLKFRLYSPMNLVTPNVSGLGNLEAMRAAWDAGVRYVVSDTSKPAERNPHPNVGIRNPLVPGIYMIPRRPTNLYFNVAAPADWIAEYNCMYRGYWGRDLSYAEILDIESQALLGYMLRGELDPWMFHQPNLVFYDRVHSLLTDLLDLTLAKYAAMFNLPVLSPSMDVVGRRMQERGALREAGLQAYRATDGTIVISAARAATVPVTGVAGRRAEIYGGQPTTWVTVPAGRTVAVRGR